MNKETFKAIKWFTGDTYYDAQSDYLHILSNKSFLNKIISSYLHHITDKTTDTNPEMLQKC